MTGPRGRTRGGIRAIGALGFAGRNGTTVILVPVLVVVLAVCDRMNLGDWRSRFPSRCPFMVRVWVAAGWDSPVWLLCLLRVCHCLGHSTFHPLTFPGQSGTRVTSLAVLPPVRAKPATATRNKGLSHHAPRTTGLGETGDEDGPLGTTLLYSCETNGVSRSSVARQTALCRRL